MKIYVAGNYKEDRHQVELIARVLEQHGHTITFKWWGTLWPTVFPSISWGIGTLT